MEKSTVFINDVCFEVAIGVPFNVREAFGEDAVLIQSSGQPVPTDEWGVTQQPLQHGVFYYLLRSLAPSPHHRTIHLVTLISFSPLLINTVSFSIATELL